MPAGFRVVLAFGVLCGAPSWKGLPAQDSSRTVATTPGDSARKSVPCNGQRVESVVIHSSAPTVSVLRRVPLLADVVRSMHVTTRPDIIRHFLLLGVGMACSEFRRAESERILRAQPFIADASVLAYPADSGSGVEIEVRSIDETSILVGGSMRSTSPFVTRFLVGNSNLSGNAVYAAVHWGHDATFRDAYGVRIADFQLGGKPYMATFTANQQPLGNDWSAEAAHPFLTDLQRVAWRVLGGSSNGLALFEPIRDQVHGINVLLQYFDAGGIVRIGPPGRLSLFGASISGEREKPADEAVLVTDTGLVVDTTSILPGRFKTHDIARVNALWGARDIRFIRVVGFDALAATQDIPAGFQLGALFGRSLSVLGSKDDDVFMSADLYIGAANEMAALRFQIQGQGRHSNDDNIWDGILTWGRLASYLKLVPAHTSILSAEWSGGWRMRVPFALSLAADPGGLLGYTNSTTLGGRRAVVRLDNRLVVARPFGLADIGFAIFGDAGRLWAGDVPFGRSTPVLTDVGVSLLGAVPPRSARLWRFDVAFPLNKDTRRFGVAFRIGNADRTSFFWQQPFDVAFARERTVPSSIFNWP